MNHQPTHRNPPNNCSGVGERIRQACLQRGWNQRELAARAGVSRTTLYQIERGGVSRPRPSTLKRIADALQVEIEEIAAEPFLSVRGQQASPSLRGRFDRSTNTSVDEVCEQSPELFSGWSAGEWEELYSTFGTGGQLTPQGVVQTAVHINRKREVMHRLNVLLETHLRDVAVSLVDSLYGLISAENAQPDRFVEAVPTDGGPEPADDDMPADGNVQNRS